MKIKSDCLGEALHTALRKGCDSTPTSIAYNAVYLLKSDIWKDYLKYLTEYQCDAGIPLWENVKNASLKYHMNRKLIEKYRTHDQMPMLVILKCSFEMFSDGDWEGYTCYINE